MFYVIVIGLLVAPSVTFAAWYNPLSWHFWSIFKKAPAPTVVTIEQSTLATTTIATSTAPASTTPVKVLVPAKPKATTVATPKVVQTTQVTAPVELISYDFSPIKTNAQKILDSRTATIESLEATKQTFVNSKYSDDYKSVIEAYDDVIDIFSVEKLMSTDIINTVDSAPAQVSAEDASSLQNAYLELYAMANDTNASKATMLAGLNNLADLSKAVVKARIELEAVNDVMAPYSNNRASTADVEQQREKISADADSYLKNLADTQTKAQTERKEKIQKYLKNIFYSPIYR